MEMKFKAKEKDCVEIEIKGATDTLLYPLVSELLKDENVAEAKYMLDLGGSTPPSIYVKMKEGKPQTAIKKAIKSLGAQIEVAQKVFAKAVN